MWKHFSILPTERPSQSLPADFWSEVSITVYPPQDVQEASTSLEAAIVGFWVRCPGCVFAWTSKHWFLLGGSSPYGVLRSFSFSKRDIPDLKASPGNCPIWGTIRYVHVCTPCEREIQRPYRADLRSPSFHTASRVPRQCVTQQQGGRG